MAGWDPIQEMREKEGRMPLDSDRWHLVASRWNQLSLIPDVIELVDGIENVSGIEQLENYEQISGSYSRIKGSRKLCRELTRYIPIGLVACIEGYFRMVCAALINNGYPYKDNVCRLQLKDISFNLKTAINLEKNNFSLGDFIGHSIRTSDFKKLCETITILAGIDFLEEVKCKRKDVIPNLKQLTSISNMVNFQSKYEYFIEEPDWDRLHEEMKNTIERLFVIRHMFCHEINPTVEDFNSVLESPQIVLEFLLISEVIIEGLLHNP